MSKHTKGRWSYFSDGKVDDCIHSEGASGLEGDIICLSPIVEGYERSAENWENNARLIVAAPDLLENLIGCMEALSSYAPDCIEVQCARYVIAKATGEQQ